MTTRRNFVAALGSMPIIVGVGRALAEEDGSKLREALNQLTKARSKVTTLTAPFTQIRTLSLLATKVKSTGRMSVKRPNHLRWELASPDEATYWALPDLLAYKTKSGSGRTARGSVGVLGGVLSDLLVWLSGDIASLRERYTLSLIRSDATGLVLHAVPKDKALLKATSRIELELASDLITPMRIVLVDGGSGADRSDIVFGPPTINGTLDDKLFVPTT